VDDRTVAWVYATMGDASARHSLMDYNTAEFLRRATDAELAASIEAAEHDGGAGVILVGDQGERRCYVEGGYVR